ncbi:hypothetical protein V6Z11_D08G007300 [Gossypium hirsutum]
MATSATTLSSLSFFSSSLFLSSPSSKLSIFPFLLFQTFFHNPSLSISSQLSTLPILSFTGEKIGAELISTSNQASSRTARAVVHRAIITDLQNKRRGTASTLTRGEKTGRARRGSTRTPLRPGGGVIFGPKPRDWSVKINKKEKRLAISTALSSAAENTIVVEDFGDKFEKPKTKEFIEALKRWGLDPKQKSMTLNLFDILNCDNLVLTPDTVDYLNGRYGEDYEGDTEDDNEEYEEKKNKAVKADENGDAAQ